jgi:hypothetical protein
MSWLANLLFIGLLFSSSARVDLTLERDAVGADVVRSVLIKLEAFNATITSTEQQVMEQFMREMAFVQSKDGENNAQNAHDGGIWGVNRNLFETIRHYNYPAVFSNICSGFCVGWFDLDYSDLRTPLYSGLAVRIQLYHLFYTSQGLQEGYTDEDMALFWVAHFGGSDVNVWLTLVQQLRNFEGTVVVTLLCLYGCQCRQIW